MKRTFTHVFLMVLVLMTAQEAMSQICFYPPSSYNSNAKSVTMAVADFTGDGKPDVAVPGFLTSNVVLMKNNGAGGLMTPVSFPVLANPSHIASGDFNNDNKRDLMVSHSAVNSGPPYNLSVLLGDGIGGFGTPIVSNLSSGLGYQAFYDFNGDTFLDFVAVKASDTLGIWYGDGQGHFLLEKNISLMGGDARTTLIEDCNNDGSVDFVVCFGLSQNMNRIMGSGPGSFGNAINVGSGLHAVDIAMADFDGDGSKDVVTASSFLSKALFLKGYASGNFGNPVSYNAVINAEDVVVADFDNDGRKDMVVSSHNVSKMSVLRGNGDGTFQSALEFNTGMNPEDLFAVDFNGDGRMDLLTVDLGNNKVSIMLNCTPVGVPEVETLKGLTVYPNPAEGRLFVQTGPCPSLRLLPVSGTVCREWQVAEDREVSLDLQGVPAGIYVLQGIGREGVSQQRVVVRGGN